MSALPFLTGESSWQDIQKYFDEEGSKLNIQDLFEKDPARFDKFKWVAADPDARLTLTLATHLSNLQINLLPINK